jgi:hypothetical protein
MSDAAPLPIHILGAELCPDPIPGKHTVWLMRLTVQIGPFLFSGLTFNLSTEGRGYSVVLPNDGRNRRTAITDTHLRGALRVAAIGVYKKLGGPEYHRAVTLPLATAPDDMEHSPK